MHVGVVIGTRPEAIKLAPVVREFRRQEVRVSVISTGQHRDMLDQMLVEFGLEPDVELSTMCSDQRLSDLTALLVERLGRSLRCLSPDYLLVQGDTTSAMCGALCGFYEGIPVGHVEAGLRTGDLTSPFPEEANRKLAAVLAAAHFCPTETSKQNLLAEGVPSARILVTGNTVIDTLLWAINQTENRVPAFPTLRPRRILLTLHRRENHGTVMANICHAITQIVQERDVEVVFSLHKSPAVRDVVVPLLRDVDGVVLSEPLGYFDLVQTLATCDLVLTDSGGLQEEAPSLGKPVLVLRNTTERAEAIEAGVAFLVGTDADTIKTETLRLLDNTDAYEAMARVSNPFGDGNASERIVSRVVTALDAVVLAALDDEGVEPQIGVGAPIERPVPERSDLSVEASGELGDLGLGDALDPERSGRSWRVRDRRMRGSCLGSLPVAEVSSRQPASGCDCGAGPWAWGSWMAWDSPINLVF